MRFLYVFLKKRYAYVQKKIVRARIGFFMDPSHHVRIAPNPAKSHASISWLPGYPQAEDAYRVEIIDAKGQRLWHAQLKGTQAIPVDQLSQGWYQVLIYQNGRLIKRQKQVILP